MALRSLENKMSSLETSSKTEKKPLLVIKKKQVATASKRTKRNISLNQSQTEETKKRTESNQIANENENLESETTANNPEWFRLFDDHKMLDSSSSEEETSPSKESAHTKVKRVDDEPSPSAGKRRRVTKKETNKQEKAEQSTADKDLMCNKENLPPEHLEAPKTPLKSCIVITRKARPLDESSNSSTLSTFERIVRSVEKKKPTIAKIFESNETNLDNESFKLPTENLTTDFTIFEDEVITPGVVLVDEKKKRKTRAASSRANAKNVLSVKYEESESEELDKSEDDDNEDEYSFKPRRRKTTKNTKKADKVKKETAPVEAKAKTQRQNDSAIVKKTPTKRSIIKTNTKTASTTTSTSKSKQNKVQEQMEKEELERLAKEYDDIKNYKLVVETVSHDYDL